MPPDEAIALGRLIEGLPDNVYVVTADKLNGATDPTTIARTKKYLTFEPGKDGLAIIDFDPKGISDSVKQQFDECGGLFGALCKVLPALETVALVERASTSSGLRNAETGETFRHSGGKHLAIPVVDAADIPRFLSDLHARCWLAGFGWGIVSAAGSFLERSIVDRFCGSPERLIFEGAPIVEPPLVQAAREAVVPDGAILDTSLCTPLDEREKADLQKLIAEEERRLLPERQAARSEWSLKHIERLIGRGIPESEARAQVDRWIDHRELTGAFALPFDQSDLAGTTVADVLADPDRFINETMADPLEGLSYGRGKAILYRRPDGSLFINSFAHGGMVYELKDAGSGVSDPLDGLVDRAKADPGVPFAVETVRRLRALQAEDRAAFEVLRGQLRRAGVRVTVLDKAIAEQHGEAAWRVPTQADQLIELSAAANPFHAPDKTSFADVEVNGHLLSHFGPKRFEAGIGC